MVNLYKSQVRYMDNSINIFVHNHTIPKELPQPFSNRKGMGIPIATKLTIEKEKW